MSSNFAFCYSSFLIAFFISIVLNLSSADKLDFEVISVILAWDFVVADDLIGRLFLEVEFFGSFSSACSVLHDFLLFVHFFNKLRSFRIAFRIDSLVQLTGVEILAELSFFSFLVSDNMESGSRFCLGEVVVIGEGRHDLFY